MGFVTLRWLQALSWRGADLTYGPSWTVRQAISERDRGRPPERACGRQRGSALGRTHTHTHLRALLFAAQAQIKPALLPRYLPK